jgi:hypothetical protein
MVFRAIYVLLVGKDCAGCMPQPPQICRHCRVAFAYQRISFLLKKEQKNKKKKKQKNKKDVWHPELPQGRQFD